MKWKFRIATTASSLISYKMNGFSLVLEYNYELTEATTPNVCAREKQYQFFAFIFINFKEMSAKHADCDSFFDEFSLSFSKLTSFVRFWAPGFVINAIPLHITAVSSMKAHSGKFSSGGNSTTSSPSSRNKLKRTQDTPSKIDFSEIFSWNLMVSSIA